MTSSNTCPWAAAMVGFCEPPQDGSEVDLIDSVGPLNVLIVNQSSTVKKSNNHDLCTGNPSASFLRAMFSFPKPGH